MGTLRYCADNRYNMQKTIYTTKYRKLVDRIKKERLDQGLSMRDLGGKLNITHSFVSKIEQCERKLDVFEFVQYCEALNISPEDTIKILKKK